MVVAGVQLFICVVGEQIQTKMNHLYVQLYFDENEHFAIYYHACAIRASLPIDVYAIVRLCSMWSS